MLSAININFTIIKYFNYLILGLRGLVIARILGPYYLGLYSLFLLYQQYLLYSNLGVQYTLSVELSKKSNSENEIEKYVGSTFIINGISIIILLTFFVCTYFSSYKLFTEENLSLSLLLIINTFLFNSQDIFINIFRTKNKLYLIALLEIISSVVIFCVVPFFKGMVLVKTILVVSSILLVFTNLVFWVQFKRIKFNLKYVQNIFLLSIPFVLYHFFYNLLFMGLRSYIAYFYSYDIVGNFSFAYNIISIFLLLTNSITWIAYPKVIGILSDKSYSDTNVIPYLAYLVKSIFLLQLILSFFAFISSPFIFYFFPEYVLARNFFYMLLFCNMYVGILFPFVTYHLSRNNYWKLFYNSLAALAAGSAFLYSIYIFKLELIWALFAYLITLFLYFNLLVRDLKIQLNLDFFDYKSGYSILIQFFIILPSLFALYSYNLFAFYILVILVIYYIKDYFNFIKTLKNSLV